MYANNMFNLIAEFCAKETNEFILDLEDDILQSCVITHGGSIINPVIRQHLNLTQEASA